MYSPLHAMEVPGQQQMTIRVHASMHSNIYFNAFSAPQKDEQAVNSVPSSETQPSTCCGSCFSCCPTCCEPRGAGKAEGYDSTLRETLEVDASRQTLLVSSGYTFKDCLPELKVAGLLLQGTPEASTISIGGALAVGAHGGGLFQAPICGYVLELWIRDAQGVEHKFIKGAPDFAAAVVSLGLLGVITRVKLQCKKKEYNTKVVATRVNSYSAEGLATATDRTHSFQFAPYRMRMVRYDENDTLDSAPDCLARCYTVTRAASALPLAIKSIECCLPCCPCLACVVSQVLVCPGTCTFDGSDNFMPTPAAYAYTVEYSFDTKIAGLVFEKLVEVVKTNAAAGRYVTFRFWCRYIGAVPAEWALALSAGGDKVAFEFTLSTKQPGVDEFLGSVFKVFQDFNGRPHLGKTIRDEDVEYAAKVYGGYNDGAPFRAFEETRKKFDPRGTFMTKTLAQFVTTAMAAAVSAGAAAAGSSRC
mmetsp:Transcript_171479/g.549615  ORF Transcript_171479/g.549615 Transcript_171479/m.549615 type:complete len:474 (-) Transcript_171479:219-1640(-)